ncbi:MAG: efflux RND transporter periplasmic adaptor subunit [Pseudomonadota bacterium]|nr:efflux RND transporter periplasmic adaptor subunit [Pseudomonadota bacterium]
MSTSQSSRFYHYFLAFFLAICLFGGVVLFHVVQFFFVDKAYQTREMRPVVSTQVVTYQSLQPKLGSIGTLLANQSVDVSAQVSGMIEDILFTSGESVTENQPLIKLDSRVAELKYQMDTASLAYKKENASRQNKLFASQATSEDKRDLAHAEYLTQKAITEQDKIMVDYHTIRAPFTGKIGLKNINIGQFIGPGTPLLSLQHVDPIKIDFTMAGKHISAIEKGMIVHARVDQFPNKVFTGTISAIDSLVNQSTRTIKIRAQIANPDAALIPGQSASLDILLPEKPQTILLPRTAVTVSLYGNTVYVVEKIPDTDDRYIAKPVVIQTGVITDESVEVISGVNPGQTIVISAQNKLYPGVEILINNDFPQ